MCDAITKQGARCRAPARAGSRYCFHHDPACAAQRHEARVKGGKARQARRRALKVWDVRASLPAPNPRRSATYTGPTRTTDDYLLEA